MHSMQALGRRRRSPTSCCRRLVVSDTRKFDREELHWLSQRGSLTSRLSWCITACMHGQAPRYLADPITPASDVASRLRLRSSNRQRHLVQYLAVDSTRTTSIRLSSLLVRRLELVTRGTQISGAWFRQIFINSSRRQILSSFCYLTAD